MIKVEYYSLVLQFYALVWGFQGWVSFLLILTKPDVEKMVNDLFAGKLCCQKQTVNSCDTIAVATTTNLEAFRMGEEITQHDYNDGEHEPEQEDQDVNVQKKSPRHLYLAS